MSRILRQSLVAAAIVLLFPCAAALATSADQTLVILHTNDFHGHPLKFNYQGLPDVGGLPAGEITKKRIYEILPFDNTVVVLKMKGRLVLRLFDHMAAVPAGAGAFPQVSEGVCFTINSSARKSEGVTINGRPIDPEKTYAIATNSYLAGGGDGYKILLEAVDRYDTSTFQRDALIEYIATVMRRVKPELEGRIQMSANTSLPFFTPCRRDSLPQILVSSHLCCLDFEIPAH